MRANVIVSILITVVLLAVSFLGFKALSDKTKTVQPENETNLSASSDKRIQSAQENLRKFPNMAKGYNRLAAAFMQVVRETGDFSLNAKAEESLKRSLEIESDNYEALKLRTKLLLTFHRFKETKELSERLLQTNKSDHDIYGALTDANVELGFYEEAVSAAQQMVDLRPDMSSYARVAHIRSLYGDTKGAIEAMRTATQITDPNDKEAQGWCHVKLGDEFYQTGQYIEAETEYDKALNIFPDYYLALAAKGRGRMAQGDFVKAIEFYKRSIERVPQTETVIALGDVYASLGKPEEARNQYQVAEFIEQRLNNTDKRRLALLWADLDVKLDEALAIAEREKQTRKDIFTADVLAWCLYKKGRYEEAKTAIEEAMRLKTKDARIFYHAGMIANALGNKKEGKRYLKLSLQTNSAFDVLQAEKARQNLQASRK